MSGFDWLIIAVLALSVIAAAAQGFFFEVFSLAGAVVGYLLAAWEYWRLAPWFEQDVKSHAMANASAFMTIFFCVMLIAGIAGKITRWLMKEVGLRWVDRLLGAAFGMVRGILVVSILVLATTSFAPDSKWLERSQLAGYFAVSARAAAAAAPAAMREQFQNGIA